MAPSDLALPVAGEPRGMGHATRRDCPTVVAASVRAAVMRTYILEMNARMQAQAILLGGKITYIEPEEPGTILGDGGDRAWDFWKRSVSGK